MWPEIAVRFEAQRATLARVGVDLRARVEPCGGLLSAYQTGVIRVATVSLDTPDEALRATLHAGLLGVTPAEAAWLFRALAPRLVGHEIGHALRAERALLGADVRLEEQVADRAATLLSAESITPADRARARTMLRGVIARLGGLAEAAAMHRHAPLALARFGVSTSPDRLADAQARLQNDYFRDLGAYLRLTVAWCLIDLSLDVEDSLDAFRRDHLTR